MDAYTSSSNFGTALKNLIIVAIPTKSAYVIIVISAVLLVTTTENVENYLALLTTIFDISHRGAKADEITNFFMW